MITIHRNEEVRQLHDLELRNLVEGHFTTAQENGLENLTCIAIVEPADSEQTMIDALGFSPLSNTLSETRFGDPAFNPAWDWLEVHSNWYELIFTAGDDGFAYILFAPIQPRECELTRMCEYYGREAGS